MKFCVISNQQCVYSGHEEPVILTNNADLHVWGYTRTPVGYSSYYQSCLLIGFILLLLTVGYLFMKRLKK
jgi:hypothetical protein